MKPRKTYKLLAKDGTVLKTCHTIPALTRAINAMPDAYRVEVWGARSLPYGWVIQRV